MSELQTLQMHTTPAYDIIIGTGLLRAVGERILPGVRRVAVVTDTHVASLYLNTVTSSFRQAGMIVSTYTVPAGEASKNMETLAALLEFFASEGLSRTDCIAALGGGMIGDLAGFAASVYLRGIRYIQLPTTLLSQVDSSMGGKTAIDLQHGKNLAGAFWQPGLVLIDTGTLQSLSDSDFSDGMAEVIKYGCIADRAFFDFLCAHASRETVMAHIETILHTCCRIKAQIVEADERDSGVRRILNFGHTLGHAYELAGHYEICTHGQAVAAGMFAAAQLGFGLGITSDDGFSDLLALLNAFNLPAFINCDWETMVAAIGLDKKREGDDITMVFLEKIGRAILRKMPKEAVLQNLEAIYGR